MKDITKFVVCCSRDWRFIVMTSFKSTLILKCSAAQLFKIKNACYLSIRISCNSLCDSGVCEGVDQPSSRTNLYIFIYKSNVATHVWWSHNAKLYNTVDKTIMGGVQGGGGVRRSGPH